VFVFLQALPFLLLPDGSKIRPMGWVFITVIIGLFLIIRGLVFVIKRYRSEPNKFAWVIVCFLPYPNNYCFPSSHGGN